MQAVQANMDTSRQCHDSCVLVAVHRSRLQLADLVQECLSLLHSRTPILTGHPCSMLQLGNPQVGGFGCCLMQQRQMFENMQPQTGQTW